MKDFIIKLYEYENFPIYLGSIIFILIIAFFVVFFLGRKEQKKIEKTQKLEKVNDDAFKEVSAPGSLEIEASKLENNESNGLQQEQSIDLVEKEEKMTFNTTSIEEQEPINDTHVISETVEAPIIAPPVIEEQAKLEVSNIPNYTEELKQEETPSFEESFPENSFEQPIETPTYDYDSDRFDDLANSIASELNELEKQQEIARPILEENPEPEITSDNDLYKIASFSNDTNEEPEKKATIVNDVFSSVYAPKKEEPIIEDTMAIELPKLKEEAILKEEEEPKLNL